MAILTGSDFDGAYLQEPQLELRVGAGSFRAADLSVAVRGGRRRDHAEFPLPNTGRRSIVGVNILISNVRAGEPWAPRALVILAEGAGNVGDRIGNT